MNNEEYKVQHNGNIFAVTPKVANKIINAICNKYIGPLSDYIYQQSNFTTDKFEAYYDNINAEDGYNMIKILALCPKSDGATHWLDYRKLSKESIFEDFNKWYNAILKNNSGKQEYEIKSGIYSSEYNSVFNEYCNSPAVEYTVHVDMSGINSKMLECDIPIAMSIDFTEHDMIGCPLATAENFIFCKAKMLGCKNNLTDKIRITIHDIDLRRDLNIHSMELEYRLVVSCSKAHTIAQPKVYIKLGNGMVIENSNYESDKFADILYQIITDTENFYKVAIKKFREINVNRYDSECDKVSIEILKTMNLE